VREDGGVGEMGGNGLGEGPGSENNDDDWNRAVLGDFLGGEL
jgi:hypothetical protein